MLKWFGKPIEGLFTHDVIHVNRKFQIRYNQMKSNANKDIENLLKTQAAKQAKRIKATALCGSIMAILHINPHDKQLIEFLGSYSQSIRCNREAIIDWLLLRVEGNENKTPGEWANELHKYLDECLSEHYIFSC